MLDREPKLSPEIQQRLHDALNNKQHFVNELHDEGYTKQQIYNIYLQFIVFLRDNGMYEEYDFIADNVLDPLTAWGKPRLLPDEPDAQ
jgi:hypothetical protein